MVKKATSEDQSQAKLAEEEAAASGGVDELRQAHLEVYNAALAQGPELVKELMKIVKYRGRGSNLAASIRAGEMLFGLIGINTGGNSQTAGSIPAGMIINNNGEGPLQVVGKSATGTDRLTQELIDIVRKGNNGKGNNGHKPNGKK